ncbi:hypothetical protein C0Q44_21930 [Paenibacillus sp. PCH8]|uniref:GyrI-like domain-containing protein n=1 Tax=Paenibacillus sp. PCH8 TaxID=2066524 RepID=UPI000CFA0F3A|nr:effector binding domain-containing protein [Paenibacillus sp. PCH8]PQP81102.1 hypothetical protein C0Q44_21930 [Paenibacillus sp. PCH8]
MTPAKLRKLDADQLSLLNMQRSNDFNDYRTRIGDTFQLNTPRLITREPYWIIGYEYKTNLNDDQHYAEIPGFYQEFGMEQKFMKIPERVRPDMAYGVACHFEEEGAFSFIVGEESNERSPVLEQGFTSIEIPGGT